MKIIVNFVLISMVNYLVYFFFLHFFFVFSVERNESCQFLYFVSRNGGKEKIFKRNLFTYFQTIQPLHFKQILVLAAASKTTTTTAAPK